MNKRANRVLLKLFIHVIFLIIVHGNVLIRAHEMRMRLSRNFHKFPPAPQYPDFTISISCAPSSITFSISTTFPVSCFRAASAYFDHSGYLGGVVSLVVTKPSASPSAVVADSVAATNFEFHFKRQLNIHIYEFYEKF